MGWTRLGLLDVINYKRYSREFVESRLINIFAMAVYYSIALNFTSVATLQEVRYGILGVIRLMRGAVWDVWCLIVRIM